MRHLLQSLLMISDAFATEIIIFCFGQDHLVGSSTTAPL